MQQHFSDAMLINNNINLLIQWFLNKVVQGTGLILSPELSCCYMCPKFWQAASLPVASTWVHIIARPPQHKAAAEKHCLFVALAGCACSVGPCSHADGRPSISLQGQVIT